MHRKIALGHNFAYIGMEMWIWEIFTRINFIVSTVQLIKPSWLNLEDLYGKGTKPE